MQITLALSLPRDESTIPMARHIAREALREVGVEPECSMAVEVALTEAVSNVVRHSGPGDEYEVSITVTPECCTIRVIDTGRGFDQSSMAGLASDVGAEGGRGMELMRALVDQVTFVSKPEAGTVVRLEKALEFAEYSLMERLGVGAHNGASHE